MKRLIAILASLCLLIGSWPALAETATAAETATPAATSAPAETTAPSESPSPNVTAGRVGNLDISPITENGVTIAINITDDNYLEYVEEIGGNASPYLGLIVALDGMFTTISYGEGGPIYRLVYRNSPSCGGNNGYAGFEVIWDDPNATYPEENDWVRAVGVLEQYLEDGMAYLQLRLISLEVLPERGQENVTYNDPSGVQIPLY